MTVVSFSTTRAADDTTVVPTNWTKVAFNSDFRYSQWVINSRLGDFYGNSTQVGFTQYDGNGNIVGSAKKSKFDYVPGLVAKATLEARDLYKDFDWSKPWFYTVLNYGDTYRYASPSDKSKITLDNMNAAKMYFGIAADALATSRDKTLSEEQIAGIIKDMKRYNENWAIGGANSNNELGNDVAGGWFHKPGYVDQMWGDGLYMGSALLAQIINNKGTSANVTDNDWDLITKQFRISWKYMYNETNGLLWHAFTANRTTAKDAGWEGITADGSTYHSAAHWGRACGWYFLALVDVLEQMQIQIKAGKLQEADANYNELKNYVNLLAEGLASCQDDSGCWYQVLDEKVNHLAGNYLESSCTAIFTAAYLKGARLDLFGDKKNDYIAVAEKAYKGFVNNFMMRDANGDAQLIHCCASAGLGGSKQRSGSRDYYITGSDVTQRNTYTEGKVLGGFILAATEYERIHAKDKPVLLTLDLQPECKLDGKTALEVAVNGNGNEKYQWYEKTTGAISGAQSATYTPTNDGTYYCAITVPATSSSAKGRIAARAAEYTLTSSETNVTVTAETGGGENNEGSGGETENTTSSTIATFENLSSTSKAWTAKENNGFTVSGIGSTKDYLKSGLYAVKMSYKKTDGTQEATTITLNVPVGYTVTSLKISAVNSSDAATTEITVNNVEKVTIDKVKTEFKEYEVSLTNPVTGSNTISITNSGGKELGISKIVVLGYQGTPSSLTITTQPEGATYGVNDVSVTPLNVVVSATGISSEISYQWYSNTTNSTENGKPIETAKSASYTPSVANAGTTYYYCVATAGGKSVTSEVAAVAVLNKSDIAYTTACGGNSNTWTPAAGGTIALSDLVTSSSAGAYRISAGDAATLSDDGTTLTAVKSGTITLTQAADAKWASGSVDINIAIGTDVAKDDTNAYTIESGKVYSDGMTIALKYITMTFGNDGFWAKGTTFSAGQINPTPNSGNIPTSGTYYKFRPTKNGTLTVNVYIGTTTIKNADGSTTQQLRPLYVSENGTAIAATAGSYTVGKGETPAATEAYQGDVTFNVKANTDYYVYVNGSKMRFYGFKFDPVFSSDNTATFSRGVLNGETLTVTHHKSEANSAQTITVTPAIGATCTYVSGPATLDGDVIRYTAPVVGASLAAITLTVKAENDATKTYTINVSTVGDVTIGNATFSLDELRRFGTRSDKGEVTGLSKENVTLTATENGVIEGGQTGTKGTKVKSGAGFTITPNNGVRITKITIVTENTGRWFTATPTQEGEMKRTDKTYEYSFNSIDQAVTFMNNSGDNLYANHIIVEYEYSVSTGKTILTASFDKDELSFYEDDTEISALPVLSVKIGDEVADAALYTVTYTSSNTKVVTVDTNGKLTNVGAGSAVINAEITPNDVNKYVGSEAFYTVTVKPLDIPTVYAHDITVYNTAGMQPEPVVDVYVKDEAGRSISLPKDYYTLAYIQQSGDAILISDKTGKFILAGEAGNWTTGSAVVRVEFSPTDDARQQYHITDTYVDFNVHVVNAGAKLVPEIVGVSEARMQISDNTSERSFVTPVLYDGVDISSGFTFKYTLRDAKNTGSKFQNAASDGSVTSKGDGSVTLLSGKTAGIVYINITATPDENYKSLYNTVTKTITVTVADLKCYNSVTITPSSITAKVGDVLQGFDIVVRDENDNIVSEDDYTMFWGSSAPGVVAIAGNRGAGVFKTMAAGQAIVRVFVTAKDGKYSDRKGECKVTVIDDGTFKVTPEKIAELTGDTYDSSKENYGITASKLKGLELSVSDGLSVVLGGWMFPNSVQGSHGTTTETLGVDQWGAPTSTYRKPLGFTHNIQMGNQKNARQEYGSNCQPESNCIYDKTLTEVNDGFKLMDPMFNVPCSGSYLAFYPKTTGTVTVYIRQNGVFDNQTKNGVTTCVYRPQRRVFVIDEMGNFVSSTPKLEYPTTWKDNGLDTDGKKYTCDILGDPSKETNIYDIANTDATITGSTDKEKVQNWVKTHFEGLKTFDIAPDKFQNGVYASNLDNAITHNNAQLNHSGDRAAKGWCVLTAAPVSYKFNVKAGKTYYLYNFGSKLGLFGFTFRPTDFVVDEKTWSQTSETNSPEKTPANHVAKVSIPDRTFPAGIWSACVLPFSMNRIQVNNVFGDCYDKNNPNGTQILYFDRVEGHKIYFRRHAYNTIVAGKPFLIKPTKEAVISSENMGTKFPYVTIEAETPQAEWGRTAGNKGGIGSIDTDYTWVSSYGSMTALPGDYYLNGNGDVSHCTEGHQIPIKGFRGYLKAKTKQAASKVLKLAYDSNVDGDGEATPIEGLVMDREGNLLEVPTSGVVYNLSGQVVTRDADKLYTLPAGIYIVNGKKYIVR